MFFFYRCSFNAAATAFPDTATVAATGGARRCHVHRALGGGHRGAGGLARAHPGLAQAAGAARCGGDAAALPHQPCRGHPPRLAGVRLRHRLQLPVALGVAQLGFHARLLRLHRTHLRRAGQRANAYDARGSAPERAPGRRPHGSRRGGDRGVARGHTLRELLRC